VEIRLLDPADVDVALDVRTRSFGPLSAGLLPHWRSMTTIAIDEGRALAAYDGSTVVAVARIHDFTQWWGGRSVRLAGIAGVVVAPEHRGRGAGTQLMRAVLEHARDRGYLLSALYPATVPVYRGLGYELAGVEHKITIPTEAVRELGRRSSVALSRTPTGGAAEVRRVLGALHEQKLDCGPIMWSEQSWQEELDDEDNFLYVAEDGVLMYGWDGARTLQVHTLVAGSADTARALWSVLGSGSSVAETVKAVVAPHDPIHWLLRDRGLKTDDDEWWMLRLLDAPAAIAGRGFPAGVTARVALDLVDAQFPANGGRFVLEGADGSGALVAGNDDRVGAVRLDARGMAALYAGTPMSTLRIAGLAAGGTPSDDAALDAAFAARPFMLDYF
jgi:predicted acetyltransferase